MLDESELASFLVVDRVDDSTALAESLRRHLDWVRSDAIDPTHNENVLTFYGLGGMGKTRLSNRLEHWLRGEIGDDTEWGRRPIENALTARWDLDHGDGTSIWSAWCSRWGPASGAVASGRPRSTSAWSPT